MKSESRRKPVARTRSRQASLYLKFGLALFVLAFCLLVTEGLVRYAAYRAEEQRNAQWLEFLSQRREEKSQRPGARLALNDIIQPSKYPDVIYQLSPNMEMTFHGAHITVNEDGFRGPRVAKAKDAGVFRILGLGDSVMFGHGVDDGEEFLQVMLETLTNECPERRFEGINTGVSGYNTAMEVAVLENVGLAWQPDLVILDFVRNDFSLPNFIVDAPTDFLALDRSFLWEWFTVVSEQDGGFANPMQPAGRTETGGTEDDPELVPSRYAHMVGHAGFRRAMVRLHELAEEHGFVLVVTTHRYREPVVTETCQALGVPLIRGEEAVNAYAQEHGIETYRGSELTVSESDPHPSAVQHRILGEYYAKLLLATGAFD